MLEYTEEDKSDEGPPSSSVVERSPAVNKTETADRLVYKLVKVGDDGSVLPATEDEVFQSLVGSVLGHKSNLSVYMSTGDAIGDYKRQRRPNPRYFDFDAKGDPAPPAMPPLMTLRSSTVEPAATGTSPEKLPLQPSSLVTIIPRNACGWGSQQSFIQIAGTHRARAVVNQKPSTWTSTKVQAPKSVGVPVVNSMPNPTSLENLSIRELHEAFRSTYGRDTSVKDKHWLKRQISTGWSKQRDAALTTELVTERDKVNGGQELGTNGIDLTEQLCTNDVDSKQSLCRALPLALIFPKDGFDASAPGNLNELGAGGAQIAVFGEVVDTGKQVGGKRQRKPNRHYIEDEREVGPGTVIANCSQQGPGGSDSGGHGSGMSSRLSWRTVIRDTGPADLVVCVWCIQKHKAEGRATKLVKMTHSAAPPAQHDTEGTVLKVKFRLPAAPGRDKISCNLWLQILGGAGPAGEQLVAAPVPTANGGTRRKHHRPWTLREVMTLVEGVAHCGGGKWADIKKLAFSSIGYRTAVDLKDKWRNLLRASRAQLYPPKQGERKKQFTAAIPDTLLAQVRELAAIQHQEVPGTGAAGMTSHSHSGRTVHRK
ncbi:unnamed protein product [Sphagnum balticum]